MSKKQLDHLRASAGLAAAAALLLFPGGVPLQAFSQWIPALLSAILALGLAHSLFKLGRLHPSLRIGILFPAAFSAPIILGVLPHPLTVLWLLLPFALILISLRSRLSFIPPPLLFGAFLAVLACGALGLLETFQTQPHQGLPRLPGHLVIWLCILAVIPLGFASRPMLIPMAKFIARYQIWTALLLTGLYPLIWCAATAFKIPGEPAAGFHDLKPLPRFFLLPAEEIPPLTPDFLGDNPLRRQMLFTLNEMSWRLTDVYLQTTFAGHPDLSPAEMLRAMKLYGFLQEDRHGNFLSGESFGRGPPPEMDPRYLADFRESMKQVLLSETELAEILALSTAEAGKIFRELEIRNLVRRVPGPDSRYRLTSQARHPFENGLYPRQLLLLDLAEAGEGVELVEAHYAPRRKLPSHQITHEFDQLRRLGAAETRQTWKWNLHSRFLLDPQPWRKSGLLIMACVLALLAGRRLPDRLRGSRVGLLTLAGLLLTVRIPDAEPFLTALRIGWGLWLARNLFHLNGRECDRLSLFAACGFITAALMPLPSEAALVHRCAWVLIWTLPAVPLLALAVRPLPDTE